jgi:hypothetical protein
MCVCTVFLRIHVHNWNTKQYYYYPLFTFTNQPRNRPASLQSSLYVTVLTVASTIGTIEELRDQSDGESSMNVTKVTIKTVFVIS